MIGPLLIYLTRLGLWQSPSPLQDQRLISVHQDIGPAFKSVAAIAKVSGVMLVTEEPLASETVFLHAKERPLGEVLLKLADATGGQWTLKGNTYVLRRDLNIGSASSEVEKRLHQLSEYRDNLLKYANSSRTDEQLVSIVKERGRLNEANGKAIGDGIDKKLRELDDYDPAYRFLGRCLQAVDLSDIAKLAPQASITFTTQPDASQRLLSQSAIAALKKLIEEQSTWGPILKKYYKPDQGTFFTNSTVDFAKRTNNVAFFITRVMPWTRSVPYPKDAVTTRISVLCYSENSYTINLKLFDASQTLVEDLEFSNIGFWPKDNNGPEPIKKHVFATVQPSVETKSLWRRVSKGTVSKGTYDRFMLDPVNNDPLWFGNHEILGALSFVQPKSIVACLPDIADFHLEHELSPSNYLDNPGEKGLKLDEEINWLVITPKDVANHRAHRDDRRDLAAYAKELYDHNNYDILLYAPLEVTESRLNYGYPHLIDPYFRFFHAAFNMPFQTAFTKLLTSLNKDQLARIMDGQTIAYRDLRAEQVALCSQIVYGARVNVSVEGDADPGQLGGSILNGDGIAGTRGNDEYVCFHTGSAKKAPFTDVMYTANTKEDGPWGWMGPPPWLPDGGMKNATYDFRRTTSITLKCLLKGKNAVIGKFEQPRPPGLMKPISFDQLPEAIKPKIQKYVKFLDEIGQPIRKRDGKGK